MQMLRIDLPKFRRVLVLDAQCLNPLDRVCRRNQSEQNSEAVRRAVTRGAPRLPAKSKEAEGQPSALWEMVGTRNKRMLVTIDSALQPAAADEGAHL